MLTLAASHRSYKYIIYNIYLLCMSLKYYFGIQNIMHSIPLVNQIKFQMYFKTFAMESVLVEPNLHSENLKTVCGKLCYCTISRFRKD